MSILDAAPRDLRGEQVEALSLPTRHSENSFLELLKLSAELLRLAVQGINIGIWVYLLNLDLVEAICDGPLSLHPLFKSPGLGGFGYEPHQP